jgi:hypothetical protein
LQLLNVTLFIILCTLVIVMIVATLNANTYVFFRHEDGRAKVFVKPSIMLQRTTLAQTQPCTRKKQSGVWGGKNAIRLHRINSDLGGGGDVPAAAVVSAV